MAKGNVAAEPSMEEILASIRRIIADEDTTDAKPKGEFIADALPDETGDFGTPKMSAVDNVLDLAAEEEAAVSGTIPAKPVARVDMDDLSFDGQEKAAAPVAARPKQNEWSENVNKPAPRHQTLPPQSYTPPQNYAPPANLVSAHTGAAVSAAFNTLASSIFSNEPRTIEDLTKDMLNPLLKQWLDDNLPSLVERIVREEIERVARGRR
jgi:cell pole-organizing protein PopZ